MIYAQLTLTFLAAILLIIFISTDNWRRKYKKNKERETIMNDTLKNIDELQEVIKTIEKMNLSDYRKEDLLKHIRYAIDGMKRDLVDELGTKAFNELREASK